MFKVIYHILKKEFIQTLRDKRMRAVLIIAPVIQLIIFGYAVTFDIRSVPTIVCDKDNTQKSRKLLNMFWSAGCFDIISHVEDEKHLLSYIDKGKAKVAIYIPHGFAKKLKRFEQASIQVMLDGTQSNTATVISGYISQIIGRYAGEIIAERKRKLAGILQANMAIGLPSIEPEVRVWYNPSLKSSVFMVPGVICSILMIMTVMLAAMGITKEYEKGTMEQLIVTPIKSYELIIGKVVPYAIIGFIDVILIIIAARLVFHISIVGSILFLFLITAFFLLTTLGLGLFISTISRTQQQAMMTTFFFFIPALILSGFFFPIANMPKGIQYVTYLNPLRYFITVIRGIILKGNSISILWPQTVILLVFGLLVITTSSLRFKKKLG